MIFTKKQRSVKDRAYRKLGEGLMRLEERELMAIDLGADPGFIGPIAEDLSDVPAEESTDTDASTDSSHPLPTIRQPSRQVFIEGTDDPNLKDVVTIDYGGTDSLRITAELYDLQGNLLYQKFFFTQASQTSSIDFRGYRGTDVLTNNTHFLVTANGGDGDDVFYGGTGRDSFNGGTGDDLLVGRGGDDSLLGGAGDDRIYGGEGHDHLHGDNNDSQNGNDIIYGHNGHDTIYGWGGNDRIYAGAGDDYVHGGAGHDVIFGDLGNDRLYGMTGDDAIYGDNPWLAWHQGGDDIIYGYHGDDGLYGGGGDDTIVGGDGSDYLMGDAGDDYLDGGKGWLDRSWGGSGSDTFVRYRTFWGGDEWDPIYDYGYGDRVQRRWYWW
ncbi:MAG: calcium-binding protein [Pirellulaceae bacterium]